MASFFSDWRSRRLPMPTKHSDMSHHVSSALLGSETRQKQIETCPREACFSNARVLSHNRSRSSAALSVLSVLLWSSFIFGTVSAQTHVDPPSLLAVNVGNDLAWKGSSLYIDHRPPPIAPLLMPPVHNHDEARDTPSTRPSKRGVNTDPSSGSSNFTIPEPLDTGLSNNFTTACASFLNRMRTNDAFKKCHPFSLMLQTSSAFFDASKSYLRITQTLDATCGVNATQCRKVMDDYSRELMSATACKTDLANDNPLVIQALNGLIAYPVAYAASCLRDDDGKYCFANAVTNLTAPTDSLPYYLPVGQELPGSSRPTCNSCLQDTMAVFAQYANNNTQPVSKTYSTAAQQLSVSCGRTFVNVTAAPLRGAASTSATLAPQLTLLLMVILFFFQ